MKAIVYAPNGGGDLGEWSAFRTEGRYAVHFAMGFAELGYEVDVINNCSPQKEIYKGVTMHAYPSPGNHHDLAFVYSAYTYLRQSGYDKSLCMGVQTHDPRNFKAWADDRDKFVYPNKAWKDEMVEGYPELANMQMDYMPPLFPMPSYSKTFLPCTFTKKRQLNLLVNYFTWCGENGNVLEWYNKIISTLKEMGYEVNVRVLCQACTPDTLERAHGATRIITPINYKDVYEQISWCDIGLTSWVMTGSSMQWDFISLGKPLICLETSSGLTCKHPWTPIYKHKDKMVFNSMTGADLRARLEDVMADPADLCATFQAAAIDAQLDNWMDIVRKLL